MKDKIKERLLNEIITLKNLMCCQTKNFEINGKIKYVNTLTKEDTLKTKRRIEILRARLQQHEETKKAERERFKEFIKKLKEE